MERKNYSFSRKDILSKAYDDFLHEVYERAQPSLDIHKYVEDVKAGKINPKTEDPPLYDKHYMPHNLIKYISDKYKEAYRIKNEWISDCDLLIKDFKDGGSVDKYIPEHIDEYGNKHPGYRGYDKRPPINELIKTELVKNSVPVDKINEIADLVTNVVLNRINEIKDFYRHDYDETRWENTVWLGSTPTSNKEKVEEYWKSIGQPFEVKEIPEDDYYYYDNGYSDEEIAEDKQDFKHTVIDE